MELEEDFTPLKQAIIFAEITRERYKKTYVNSQLDSILIELLEEIERLRKGLDNVKSLFALDDDYFN
jgi:hypothetical protein